MELAFVEQLDGGGERSYDGGEATFTFTRVNGQWRHIRGRFKVRNRTEQTVFTVLAYFSELYGIYILPTDPIPPGDNWVTVWGEGPDDHFLLEDASNESTERFKLVVATEKVDDFLLMQPPLTMREEYGATRGPESIQPSRKVVHKNEWFAKDFQIRIVRG